MTNQRIAQFLRTLAEALCEDTHARAKCKSGALLEAFANEVDGKEPAANPESLVAPVLAPSVTPDTVVPSMHLPEASVQAAQNSQTHAQAQADQRRAHR
jgi:hypothetical protein